MSSIQYSGYEFLISSFFDLLLLNVMFATNLLHEAKKSGLIETSDIPNHFHFLKEKHRCSLEFINYYSLCSREFKMKNKMKNGL